jgi:hypothetical protein
LHSYDAVDGGTERHIIARSLSSSSEGQVALAV